MGKRFDRGFQKFAVNVLALVSKLRFGTRKKIVDMPQNGALLFCNHSSIWDYSYLVYAMYPRSSMRFLATAVHYDKSKFVHALFSHLGMIRKNQGTRDLQCVKDMMKASREGGIVVIYAAGMTSFDGRQAWDALPGTGSMPKLLKSDVYVGLAHGGFISYPRYAHKAYRGRVEMELKKLYTAQEAAQMDAQQLQQGISEAIKFNDWDWQEEHRIPFRHMKNMKNVSRTLYMCPACGREGTLKEGRGSLTCSACGFVARRDKYGFFSSEDGRCPKRMDKWVDLELDSLKKELESDDFVLRETVSFYRRPQNCVDEFDLVAEGELKMNKSEIAFTGGGKSLTLGFSEFQFLILSDTDALIINTDQYNYRFVFKDTRLMTKWFFAHRLMAGINAD